MTDGRPDPSEMLARYTSERSNSQKGRLKIFLGAAPGVGKTFAMLATARELRASGLDTVIGIVETHGRKDTEALVEGLAVLPRRIVQVAGVSVGEFDLDLALQRRPALLLVDELAHTNAPGSRHAKRWQDVLELVDAGIDVWTTLNVQHLESASDIVAQITGITIRETVPDKLISQASEVELIDLPPDELLKRLRDGKVYVPDDVSRALDNYFRKVNLIALREMALRIVAARVDDDMVAYRQSQGIQTPLPSGARLIVCVGPSPQSAGLIRHTKRVADAMHGRWYAVFVETPAFITLPREDQERVTQNLALAESLGGQRTWLAGDSVAPEVLNFAQRHNVETIVCGKPTHARWRDRVRGSLLDSIVRGSRGMSVLVVEEVEGGPRLSRPPRVDAAGLITFKSVGIALVGLLIATTISLLLKQIISNADVAMIYMATIGILAFRYDPRVAAGSAVVAGALFDFFFVPPYYTFAISDMRYAITFTTMIVLGIAISRLADRLRQRLQSERNRARQSTELYSFSKLLPWATTIETVAHSLCTYLEEVLDVDCVMYVQDSGSGDLRRLYAGRGWPQTDDTRTLEIVRWVADHGRPAGKGTSTLASTDATYIALRGALGTVGIVGMRARPGSHPAIPDSSEGSTADQLGHVAATAIERIRLAADARQAHVAAETEKLRNALLSSVSHDMRTPLTVIKGAAATLLDTTNPLAGAAATEMLTVIHEESDRLANLVNNLLQVTRIESGSVGPHLQWQSLAEITATAVQRLSGRLEGRMLSIEVPDDLPLLKLDGVLIEQAMYNLLDNAIKYSPVQSPIEVRAYTKADTVTLEILDRGPGFAPGTEEQIFQKFFRADSQSGVGYGLGLTVARGMITAHGGQLTARNREGGGAIFVMELPLGTPPELPVDTGA